MKEFLLIYRNDFGALPNVSQEEAQANTKKWMDWIGGIAAQNKLSNRGNRLANSGRVLKSGNAVTDGPYTEIKESVGGYSIIKADSYEEAIEIAKGCPVLIVGGNVEIREVDQV
jgi:hypothetical protein